MTYTKEFITSRDGTVIGYRQLGKGPGLILVHGGMMYSQNLMRLGELLADDFTVYIVDRRSRGLSRSNAGKSGLREESEDLQALFHKTKAQNMYGLSAGAIVVLQTAILEPGIHKIAIHEPPILNKVITPTKWMDKYREAINAGNFGKAFLNVIHGTDDPSSLFNIIPGFITVPLMNFAISRDANKIRNNSDDMCLKDLIATMPYDLKLVLDSEGLIKKAKNITADILLISGTKSQPYLRHTIGELGITFPKAKHKEFAGQGHTVSDNGGKPMLIADLLRQFFL